jgi:hypothetical protein
MNTQNVLRIVTGLALGMSLLPKAQAITGCGNNYLSGAYGVQFSGTTAPNLDSGVGGTAAPASVLGPAWKFESRQHRNAAEDPAGWVVTGFAQLILDGAGNLFGNSAATLNGAWLEGPVTGAYTVNVDCSASFTLTDSGGGVQNFSGVLVNQGDSVVFLQTDPGSGISGTLRRSRNSCQTSDLAGSFGFQSAGTVPGAATAAYSSIGMINLDGQGNLTSIESRYADGSYVQVASSGTITVNLDCTVNLTLSPTGGSTNQVDFRGVIVNNEKEMLLVQSDAGTVVSGSAIVQ